MGCSPFVHGKLFRLIQIMRFQAWTLTLSSHHRSSIGLRSGLQEDYLRVLILVSSWTNLGVYSVIVLLEDLTLTWQQVSSHYPSKCQNNLLYSWPHAPEQGSLPHSIRLPPTCLTVGTVFLALKASSFLNQTKAIPMCPNRGLHYRAKLLAYPSNFKRNFVTSPVTFWLICTTKGEYVLPEICCRQFTLHL